jgi:NAD(P)-dependent dehydrogenase (short-subunit alcohol dehydrogenase family)
MGRLEGKIAFISGAARGIGFATAQRFAEEGATVIIADINGEAAERAAAELGDSAEGLQQDVREEAGWAEVMEHVTGKHGGLDIHVNNAGILATGDTQNVENTDLAQWQALQDVNVTGVMLGCQAAVAAMKASGGGSIINLSSVAALIGTPALFAYGASKGAVRQLTKSVAVHCARAGYKIRCNSVHPGLIQTDMGDQVMTMDNGSIERNTKVREAIVPLGELGQARDIANAILFLASDDARYITGAELVVDGGFTVV